MCHCKEYSAFLWRGQVFTFHYFLLVLNVYNHMKWQYFITVEGRRTAPATRVSYTSRGRTFYQESYCRTTSRTWKVGWWGRALFAWICQTSTWPDANWGWAYKVSSNEQENVYLPSAFSAFLESPFPKNGQWNVHPWVTMFVPSVSLIKFFHILWTSPVKMCSVIIYYLNNVAGIVSSVLWLWAGQLSNFSSLPRRSMDFSLLKSVQACSDAHPASC